MRRKPLFPPPVSAATGKAKRNKGPQPYSVLTVNGRIRLRRVRWHCAQDGCETPTDRLLDELERTFSEGVREMACRVNQHADSFHRASDILLRTAHIDISKETLRQVVEGEGKIVMQALERATLKPDWTAADCLVEPSAADVASATAALSSDDSGPTTRVYGGCDGVMVPLVTDEEKKKRRAKVMAKREQQATELPPLGKVKLGADGPYKEFRIGNLYDQSKSHRYVGVTAGDCEATGKMLNRMARAIKMQTADESIGVIDGAPWIRNQFELHGIAEHLALDFYHLQDYAQKTRRQVFGEDSPEGQIWVDDLMHTFKHEGYSPAWQGLVTWSGSLSGAKATAAGALLQYAAERRDMICYPEFRARGWDIGSGPTESECKSTTSRVKGRGRRWDSANAQAMMALAALQDSNLWTKHWENVDPERN